MQLAQGSGSTGRQFRIGGVALLGAGLIAVAPLAPSLSDIQQRAVALTSGSDWMDTASDNLTSMFDRIEADPFPVLSQTFDNLSDSGLMIGANLKDSLDGVAGIFFGDGPAQGLVKLLPEALDLLSKGDLFGAYGTLNTDFLFDMLNIFQPLFNHIPHGTDDLVDGMLGLPSEMLRDLANVGDVFADFSFWKTMASATMSPFMGLNFEMTDIIKEISTAVSSGDTSAAFAALTDAPGDLLGTLLNGYLLNGEASHEFQGLLTDGGFFDEFLVKIPQEIAEALGAGTAETASGTAEALTGGLLDIL